MKSFSSVISIIITLLYSASLFAQNQTIIDSLVNELRTAGRNWTNYSNPLIIIGEPAVPGLIKNATNKSLTQWNRRISIETLNQIHSELWKKPALNILFDNEEIPDIRNRAMDGLKGFDLSEVKTELWVLYNKAENQFYKSNLAGLLLSADTALAYKAFNELYSSHDGYIQKNALLQLVKLRPGQSIKWYLEAIRCDDWMTANLAMDSLISSRHFQKAELISIYNKSNASEETQWRIVFVLGHRNNAEHIPFLVEAIQNKSWLVHTEAAVGLYRIGSKDVRDEMKKLRNDKRFFVRNNSRWVIQKLQKEE